MECGVCREVVHGKTLTPQPCCQLKVCQVCTDKIDGCPVCSTSLRATTKLHEYAAAGMHKKVRKHLARGLRVDKRDERGWTPLHFTSKGGHTMCMELLLAACADPDSSILGQSRF